MYVSIPHFDSCRKELLGTMQQVLHRYISKIMLPGSSRIIYRSLKHGRFEIFCPMATHALLSGNTPTLVLVIHKRVNEVANYQREQHVAHVLGGFIIMLLCVTSQVRCTVGDL